MYGNDLPPVLRFRPAALRRLGAIADRAHPNEACGALLGCADGAEVRRVCRLPNRAPDARRGYLISAEAVHRLGVAAAAAGLDIVGFFHSHTDGSVRPSRRDLDAAWPGYLYVIVPAPAGRTAVTAWRLREDRRDFRAVPWRPAGPAP
jgi:desampylase